MPERLLGKVAFITGAARGQGRAHAVAMAAEGADVIALDNCADVATAPYPGATADDLEITVKLVHDAGRRAIPVVADVRDLAALCRALEEAVAQLGRLDVVVANAGIWSTAAVGQMDEATWDEMVDINLSGVWRTCRAAIPHIRAGGQGGSIIITTSGAGIRATRNFAHYVAAKHGLVGLTKAMALELGGESIRVNGIAPTSVDTAMIQNATMHELCVPGLAGTDRDRFAAVTTASHALPVPWVEAEDVARAAVFLAADEARYLTGVTLPVDAGVTIG